MSCGRKFLDSGQILHVHMSAFRTGHQKKSTIRNCKMSSQTLGQLECRSYVYVLECKSCDETEHDHYYIGVASPAHLGTRLDQHWSSRAARFTRTHKPVRVAAVHRAPAEGDAVVRLERETTLQIMRECITRHGADGWQRVRGGPWCSENMTVRPPGL